MTPLRFTTVSDAVSDVLKRMPHSGHWRLRRIDDPSSEVLESVTRESECLQNGQCIPGLPLSHDHPEKPYMWVIFRRWSLYLVFKGVLMQILQLFGVSRFGGANIDCVSVPGQPFGAGKGIDSAGDFTQTFTRVANHLLSTKEGVHT